MKYFLVLGILASSTLSFACPNLTGSWKCTDSKGEKWTETIVTKGNQYKIIEKGTPEELIIADGKVIRNSPAASSYVASLFNIVAEKAVSLLPESKQAALIAALHAFQAKTNDLFTTEGRIFCEGKNLKINYAINGTMSVPLIMSVKAQVHANATETLVKKGKRQGVMVMKGTATFTPAAISLFKKVQPTTEKIDEVVTSTCVKKK